MPHAPCPIVCAKVPGSSQQSRGESGSPPPHLTGFRSTDIFLWRAGLQASGVRHIGALTFPVPGPIRRRLGSMLRELARGGMAAARGVGAFLELGRANVQALRGKHA